MVSGLRFCWPLGGPAHPRFAAVPGLLALLSDGASNVAAIKPATNTPFDGVDLPDLVEANLQPHEGQQGEGSLLPSHGDAEDVLQHDEGLLPPFRGEIADNNLANDGQDALLLADASSEHKEEKGLDPYDADNDLQKPQIEGQKSVTGVLLPINAEILFFGDVLLRAGAFDPEDVVAVACTSVHEDACEDDAAEDATEDDSAVDAYASLAYEDVPTAHADASDSEDNFAEFLEEAASTDSNEDHVASVDVVESVDVAFAAADDSVCSVHAAYADSAQVESDDEGGADPEDESDGEEEPDHESDADEDGAASDGDSDEDYDAAHESETADGEPADDDESSGEHAAEYDDFDAEFDEDAAPDYYEDAVQYTSNAHAFDVSAVGASLAEYLFSPLRGSNGVQGRERFFKAPEDDMQPKSRFKMKTELLSFYLMKGLLDPGI